MNFTPQQLKSDLSCEPRKGSDGRTRNTANIGKKPFSNGTPKPTAPPSPVKVAPTVEPEPEPIAPIIEATAQARQSPAKTTTNTPPRPPALVLASTRLNEVLIEDQPDIAASRASGKIGPNVIPEVTTSEVADTEVEANAEIIEPDQSDDEWLAELPLHTKLTGVPLRSFDSQALLYRHLEGPRKSFAHHASRAFTTAGRDSKRGPYGYRVDQCLGIDHPKQWNLCPTVKNGGCAGAGTISLIGDCPKCRGRGYLILS